MPGARSSFPLQMAWKPCNPIFDSAKAADFPLAFQRPSDQEDGCQEAGERWQAGDDDGWLGNDGRSDVAHLRHAGSAYRR